MGCLVGEFSALRGIEVVKQIKRCEWVGDNVLYQQYHDTEWGVPSYDDRHLFEMLILEGAQAGLSWLTILKKREGYQKAFDNFEAEKIVKYSAKKVERLLTNPQIVRNRLKVNATVVNAQAFLDVLEEYKSFADYIWQFVDNKPIVNKWKLVSEVPVTTKESDAMSKDLKKRGFKFVGSTICYAYMQAVGMVNDHTLDCCCYRAPIKR